MHSGDRWGDTYTSLGYAYIYEIFESIASHKCLPIFIAEAFYRLIESIVYLRKQSFEKCSGINCTVKRNKNQTEVKLAPPIARTHTHTRSIKFEQGEKLNSSRQKQAVNRKGSCVNFRWIFVIIFVLCVSTRLVVILFFSLVIWLLVAGGKRRKQILKLISIHNTSQANNLFALLGFVFFSFEFFT